MPQEKGTAATPKEAQQEPTPPPAGGEEEDKALPAQKKKKPHTQKQGPPEMEAQAKTQKASYSRRERSGE